MKRVNGWFDRAPLGVVFLYLAVIYVGIRLLFEAFDRGGLRLTDVIIQVIGGLILAAVLTGIIAFRRRRSGGAAAWAAINQGIRSGQLPPDADPAVWGPELDRRRRAAARSRILSPIVFGLFALASVVLITAGGMTAVLGAAFVVLFAAVAVWSIWAGRRVVLKIASLQQQLGGVANYHPTPTY